MQFDRSDLRLIQNYLWFCQEKAFWILLKSFLSHFIFQLTRIPVCVNRCRKNNILENAGFSLSCGRKTFWKWSFSKILTLRLWCECFFVFQILRRIVDCFVIKENRKNEKLTAIFNFNFKAIVHLQIRHFPQIWILKE